MATDIGNVSGRSTQREGRGRRSLRKPVTERAVYTVAEVAGLLGLALRNVYPMVQAGEIPARRMGGRWVIPKERFNAWLNGSEAAETADHVPAPAGRR